MGAPGPSLGGIDNELTVNRLAIRIREMVHGDFQELRDAAIGRQEGWWWGDGVARHKNSLRVAGGLLNAFIIEIKELLIEGGREIRERDAHGLADSLPDNIGLNAVIHGIAKCFHPRCGQTYNRNHRKSKNSKRNNDLDEGKSGCAETWSRDNPRPMGMEAVAF